MTKQDLNDLLQSGALPSTSEIFSDSPPHAIQLIDNPSQLRSGAPPFILGKNNDPKCSVENTLVAIRSSSEITAAVRYNAFADRIEVASHLPWPSPDRSFPRPWAGHDDTLLAAWIHRTFNFAPPVSMCADCISAFARENKYHPVREYLIGCSERWDQQPRASSLFYDYFHATQPPEYLAAVSSAFLISAVARVMKPGCKVDTIPVVDGPQGVGKSTAFAALFSPWFSDDLAAPGSKDASVQLRGVWCVEFAELKQFRASDVADIKAFLSRQVDHYRPPYERRTVDFPRQNVFVATTNVPDWQRDETGARRFWPVSVNHKIDVKRIANDKDMIWGESVRAFLSGVPWHDTTPRDILDAEHDAHREHDAIEAPVERYLVGKSVVSMADILSDALELDKGRWDRTIQMRVARILRYNGWTRTRSSIRNNDGKRGWVYVKE
jgi:putative DNA primase/helicase